MIKLKINNEYKAMYSHFGVFGDFPYNVIEWVEDNTASLIKASLLRFSGPVGALQKLDNSPTEFFEETLVRIAGATAGGVGAALAGPGAIAVAASAIAASGIASLVREKLLNILDSNPGTEGMAFNKGNRDMAIFTSDPKGTKYEVVAPGGDILSSHDSEEEAVSECKRQNVGREEGCVVFVIYPDGREEQFMPFNKANNGLKLNPQYKAMFGKGSQQQFGLLSMIGLGGGESGSPMYNQVVAELKRINNMVDINDAIDAKATLKIEIEKALSSGEITMSEFKELSRMVMAG